MNAKKKDKIKVMFRCHECGFEGEVHATPTEALDSNGIEYAWCPLCGADIVVTLPAGYRMRTIVRGKSAAEVSAVIESILKNLKTVSTNINLSHSKIGILNTGEIADVESIAVSVSALSESGQIDMAKALTRLTEAAIEAQEYSSSQRAEILDQLEELSRQAALPPGKRSKSAVIKAIVSGLAATIGAAGGLAGAWSTWGPSIRSFFGL